MYYSKYLTMLFFTFVLSAAYSGCKAEDIKPNKIQKEVANIIKQKNELEPFSITISNGGGFTGLKNGYTLNSKGLIKRWRQLSLVKDTTIWKVQTDGIKINDFKDELVKSGLLEKEYNNTGNITFILAYQISDTTYTWSWDGKNSGENIPPEIKDWFKNLTDYIISVKNSN